MAWYPVSDAVNSPNNDSPAYYTAGGVGGCKVRGARNLLTQQQSKPDNRDHYTTNITGREF